MNLDDKYICVFIRQNMFPDKQMVHNFHLGLLIGKHLDGFCQKRNVLSGHPIVLIFGEPSEEALAARYVQFIQYGIECIKWIDPDAKPEHDDFGLTGFVTEPLTKQQRSKLPHCYQWSQNKNVYPNLSK